jgi:hypothetical protein
MGFEWCTKLLIRDVRSSVATGGKPDIAQKARTGRGTSHHFAALQNSVAIGVIADIEQATRQARIISTCSS